MKYFLIVISYMFCISPVHDQYFRHHIFLNIMPLSDLDLKNSKCSDFNSSDSFLTSQIFGPNILITRWECYMLYCQLEVRKPSVWLPPSCLSCLVQYSVSRNQECARTSLCQNCIFASLHFVTKHCKHSLISPCSSAQSGARHYHTQHANS
jgi:hypothetical protein